MQRFDQPATGRHLADKRTASSGSRVMQFLRLARKPRETWHSSRPASTERLMRFVRIERGEKA